MKPLFTIVIPTWGKKSKQLLEALCPTIIEFTDLSNVEIIVVANGVVDDTKSYIESLGDPFKLIWFDEELGYARAVNEGVKIAKAPYLILLNNDTMIQGSNWIDLLYEPFKHDDNVAITGPMKNWSPESKRIFIIFFCTMVRHDAYDKVGGLDETFWSWGEDCHMCHQIEDQLGMKLVQVPIDASSQAELTRSKENPLIGVGNFPIFHRGGMSIQELGTLRGDTLINRNSRLLKERYNKMEAISIEKALKVDGWMTELELDWLAKEVKKLPNEKIYIAEIGSWKGRSSRAIADNMPDNCILFCIDTWNGSPDELNTHHVESKKMEGDYVYDYFCRNLWDLISVGKVIPLRMQAKYAAEFLRDFNIELQFLFIDGDHGKGGTRENILSYLPLLSQGATICGHDYMTYEYPNIALEVLDIWYTNVGHPQNTSIWYSTPGSIPEDKREYVIQEMKPAAIYDCFTFFNELDILEARFNELYDVVDRFVIAEATSTHQRQSKPLYFKENLHRFDKFLHKVSHIVVDFPEQLQPFAGHNEPAGEAYWALERFQRDKLMDVLKQSCRRNDTVIISDVDEIPRAEVVKNYKPSDGIKSLEQDFYYYNLNCKSDDFWKEGKILTFNLLEQVGGPCQARYQQCESIKNAGWHFSYFGNTEHIIQKVKSFAHREYNNEETMSHIEERIKEGKDLFGRLDQPFKTVELQKNLPQYILNNVSKYEEIGLIKKQ